MTTSTAQFDLVIPPGFIEVPVHTDDATRLSESDVFAVRSELHALFGDRVDTDDNGLAMVTAALVTFGLGAAAIGAQLAAAALLRSPEQDLPVLVQLVAVQATTGTSSAAQALEHLMNDPRQRAMAKHLPAGPAVLTTKDTADRIDSGDRVQTLVRREITAHVPDPTGATILAVNVSTANVSDWEHIEALAAGIFESIRWTE